MFKKLARRVGVLGTKPAAPGPDSSEADSAEMPIIVPQSAMDALDQDPWPLIKAVIDYVNLLHGPGRYNRHEVPAIAMQAYHTDYYLAQVNNGGHSQFVHNCNANLTFTLDDIATAMIAMQAEEYLMVVELLSKWLRDNPEDAAQQTGFEGGRAAALDDLDDMFYALEADDSLQERVAHYVSTAPNLLVVPDHEVAPLQQRLCEANPHRAQRERIFTVAGLEAQMTDPFAGAVSLAAGALQPVSPVVGIGNGSYRDVGDQSLMCFTLQTTAGRRWAVLDGDAVAIHDYIEHDNPDMPANPLDANMDQISKWKAPEVGARLSAVTQAQAAEMAALAKRLQAGAALDLLMSRLVMAPNIDRVTVRSAGPDLQGEPGMSLLLVLNQATQAMSAVVTEAEAFLLSEPEHQKIATVTRQQIAAHAHEYRLEALLETVQGAS